MILVANSADSIPDLTNSDLAVMPSDVAGPWADWSRCVMWTRGAGPMRGLSLDAVPGFELSDIRPTTVLTGLDAAMRGDDVFAGMFVGWLHSPVAIAAQFKAGDGKVLATTLDLLPSYGSDPAATTLLGDMIAHAAGKDFNPSLKIDLSQVDAVSPAREFGSQGLAVHHGVPRSGMDRGRLQGRWMEDAPPASSARARGPGLWSERSGCHRGSG